MDIKSRETRDLTENWDYWLEQIARAKDGPQSGSQDTIRCFSRIHH